MLVTKIEVLNIFGTVSKEIVFSSPYYEDFSIILNDRNSCVLDQTQIEAIADKLQSLLRAVDIHTSKLDELTNQST